MEHIIKVSVLLVLAVCVLANDGGKCWSEDCDNKLRDCARYIVHCTDSCHHGCIKDRETCERNEVHEHGQGKTPFSARRKCHDKAYNCIFECFNVCGRDSKLTPCVNMAERHCTDTCAHDHDNHDD